VSNEADLLGATLTGVLASTYSTGLADMDSRSLSLVLGFDLNDSFPDFKKSYQINGTRTTQASFRLLCPSESIIRLNTKPYICLIPSQLCFGLFGALMLTQEFTIYRSLCYT
jgi:hypothetical protein